MLSGADSAMLFKALADETRLKIIDMVSCAELCACDILEEFEITQPSLSYHMKILTDSGLVFARKDGAWMRYTLNPDWINPLKEFLDRIVSPQEECLAGRQKSESCACKR